MAATALILALVLAVNGVHGLGLNCKPRNPKASDCMSLDECIKLGKDPIIFEAIVELHQGHKEFLDCLRERRCSQDQSDVPKYVYCQDPPPNADFQTTWPDIDTKHHLTSGKVEILSHNQLMIRNFVYDGQGPDAFFIVGTERPAPIFDKNSADDKIIVPFPARTPQKILPWSYPAKELKLREFKGEDELTLPDGLSVNDVTYLSLYCRQFGISFGHVRFPELPRQ